MLHPNQFQVNEAWILFQLNKEPIRVESEGAFSCLALMDAGELFYPHVRACFGKDRAFES